MFQAYQHGICVFVAFVRKAPRQGDRGVHHDSAQNRLPAWIISRTLVLPAFTRLRRARMPSTTSRWDNFRRASPGGIRIAAGIPCLVIVIFSPFATRSSSAERMSLSLKNSDFHESPP